MSRDEEFEIELARYAEVETIPNSQVEPRVPQTIKLYQERIKSNNSTSIFDVDYTLDEGNSNSDSAQEVNKNIDENFGVFKDEKVTYIISGRGRGGRNILVRPGEFDKSKALNEDDEVRQQIRKVAPIGYSNEITENSVRAHKMAKVLKRDLNANINHISPTAKLSSPTISKISSPVISKPSSPVISKPSSPAILKPSSPAIFSSSSKANSISTESSGVNSISSASSKTKSKDNLNVKSPVSSRNSTPSTRANDVHSSDNFSSQDHNVSSNSSKSNHNEYESEESEDESSEAASASRSNIPLSLKEYTEANERKPAPLSVLLRQSREAHKQKQLARENVVDPALDNAYSTKRHENELASHRTIEAILRQDYLQQQMRRKQHLEKSSSSSLSSREESLSWRRRNNSPPRYSWGREQVEGGWRNGKASKKLDINSIDDFPALK